MLVLFLHLLVDPSFLVSECCADVCYSRYVGIAQTLQHLNTLGFESWQQTSHLGSKLGRGRGARCFTGFTGAPPTLNLTDWDPLVQCLAWARVQCLGAVLGLGSGAS